MVNALVDKEQPSATKERLVKFSDGSMGWEFSGVGKVVDFQKLKYGPGDIGPLGGYAMVELRTPRGQIITVGMASHDSISYLVLPDGRVQTEKSFKMPPPVTIGDKYPLFRKLGTVNKVLVEYPKILGGTFDVVGENPFPGLRNVIDTAIENGSRRPLLRDVMNNLRSRFSRPSPARLKPKPAT